MNISVKYFFLIVVLAFPVSSFASEKYDIENTHGFEISFANNYSAADEQFISAGYNYFNDKLGFEIAIPVVFSTTDSTIDSSGAITSSNVNTFNVTSKVLNVDVMFRKHRIQKAMPFKGYSYWHYGGFTRFTSIEGLSRESYNNNDIAPEKKSGTKFGIGFNVGFRTFFHIGKAKFYYGVSLSIGQYLLGDTDIDIPRENYFIFSSFEDYSGDGFLNLELAKFGYAF